MFHLGSMDTLCRLFSVQEQMTNHKKNPNSIFNLRVVPAVVSEDAFSQEAPGRRGRSRGLSSLMRRSESAGNASVTEDQFEAHAAAEKMRAAWGNGARSLALRQEAALTLKAMMSRYFPAE